MNQEGYSDPTAESAIGAAGREKRPRQPRGMAECKAMIRWVAKFYGYDVCGIKLRDRNGRIWR